MPKNQNPTATNRYRGSQGVCEPIATQCAAPGRQAYCPIPVEWTCDRGTVTPDGLACSGRRSRRPL